MNKVQEFFWKLLSTDKFNDFSAMAATRPGEIAVKAAQYATSKNVLSVSKEGSKKGC